MSVTIAMSVSSRAITYPRRIVLIKKLTAAMSIIAVTVVATTGLIPKLSMSAFIYPKNSLTVTFITSLAVAIS